MKRKNFPHRKEQRKVEALERQAAYAALTTALRSTIEEERKKLEAR